MPDSKTLYATSVVSGLLGVLVAIGVGSWLDHREIQRDVLRRLAGNRFVLTNSQCVQLSGEPFVALNEAFVVFADEPEVLAALEALRGSDRDRERIVALIKRMAVAAAVPVNLDDAFIEEPFTAPGQVCSRGRISLRVKLRHYPATWPISHSTPIHIH